MITYLKLTAVALLWGGTFVAGRILGDSVPALVSACVRFLIASACLLVIARVAEGGLPRLDRRQAMVTALLGLLGIVFYNFFFFAALRLMPASRTALLVALNPVITAVLSVVLIKRRLEARRWVGIAVSFLGATIVITRGDPAQLIHSGIGRGELLMLCGVLSWALYTIVSQMALKGLSPIAATTYGALWGTFFLSIVAAPGMMALDWRALGVTRIAALLYIATFGTALAYIWYFDGVSRLGAVRTTIFTNFVPVFGIALSMLLLHERLTTSLLVGGAIVLCGVAITTAGAPAPKLGQPLTAAT